MLVFDKNNTKNKNNNINFIICIKRIDIQLMH